MRRSWPLCHGEFIPEYAFETMVEYSHRLVTGVEGLLILGLAVTAFPLRRRYPELKALLPLMIGTLLLQSGMGAWAVMAPQTPADHGDPLRHLARLLRLRLPHHARALGDDGHRRAAARAVPAGYRALAWATLLWTVVVAYVGAYMRHSGAELACYTWPLCNGSLVPDLASPGVAVAWGHRLVALIALALVIWLALWSRRFASLRPDLYRTGLWALVFVLAQAAGGAFVTLSRLSLASTLSHAALMALLFAALADGARRTMAQRRVIDEVPMMTPSGAPLAVR